MSSAPLMTILDLIADIDAPKLAVTPADRVAGAFAALADAVSERNGQPLTWNDVF